MQAVNLRTPKQNQYDDGIEGIFASAGPVRKMPENLIQWHEDAIKDLRESNLSVSEIAAKYGRSPKTIEKLLYNRQIVRAVPTKRRGPKPKINQSPLSRPHVTIGLKLNIRRGEEKATEFAAKLGVSAYVLGQMENGLHDYRLSELLTIEKLTGMKIEQLMTPFDRNLYQQPRSMNGHR